jgi:hypothetical protein
LSVLGLNQGRLNPITFLGATQMSNLSDMKKPKVQVIELLNDKKAYIGSITLEVLCWVEDNYGDWEAFQENVLKKKKLHPLASFLFQMVQNKDDFKDEKEFFRCFAIENIKDIFNVVNKSVANGMIKVPDQSEQGTESGELEEKKPLIGANT